MTAEPDSARALEIPRDILDAMIAHCLRESPLECCGLLCGIAPAVSLFYPLRNQSQSETRYNADPQELIAAHIDFRAWALRSWRFTIRTRGGRPFRARPISPRTIMARCRESSCRCSTTFPTFAYGGSIRRHFTSFRGG